MPTDRREFTKRCGILVFSPLVFPRRVNAAMTPRTGGVPRRLGATYICNCDIQMFRMNENGDKIYIACPCGPGYTYLRGARPRYPNFSVDRVVFDDCCFQNDPCDRCKTVMDG